MADVKVEPPKPNVMFIIIGVVIALVIFGFSIYAVIRYLKRPRPVPQVVGTLLSVCGNATTDR